MIESRTSHFLITTKYEPIIPLMEEILHHLECIKAHHEYLFIHTTNLKWFGKIFESSTGMKEPTKEKGNGKYRPWVHRFTIKVITRMTNYMFSTTLPPMKFPWIHGFSGKMAPNERKLIVLETHPFGKLSYWRHSHFPLNHDCGRKSKSQLKPLLSTIILGGGDVLGGSSHLVSGWLRGLQAIYN